MSGAPHIDARPNNPIAKPGAARFGLDSMKTSVRAGMALSVLLMSGCALQPAYEKPTLKLPTSWANAPGDEAPRPEPISTSRQPWWSQLNDPAIDQLATAALRDNPTLAEAMARLDQARALLATRDAAKLPAIGIEGSAAQARDRINPTGGPSKQTSASIGASLSWEFDLWKRVRESANAARLRVDARVADAQGARLSVIGDIADNAIALRACHLTLNVRDRDLVSRETELRISRARLSFGSIAPVAVATAQSSLASARTDRIAQQESCLRLSDALVALSGVDAMTVRELFARPVPVASDGEAGPSTTVPWLPVPPPYVPALPATVLLGNPGVMAAEREVAARWSDIAVARAERMPRLDLGAVLTGQWIRALGSESSFSSNSISATLTAPLFDGGARAANARSAQAAYRQAVAQLILATRTTVRDIEDALAARQSAVQRIDASQDALAAARFALTANEARWRAGAISQFELEDSRRQFNQAQQVAITAHADRARAWVALMRLTAAVPDARGASAMNERRAPQ